MNKTKIVLSAIAAIAAMGFVFALKPMKYSGSHILLDANRDGICTTEALGYASSTPILGGYFYDHATNTDADSKACTYKYYVIFN